ncbi:MAG: tetratricopeptide repeat protein, partial [Planctomycetota bacterium]
FPGGTNDSNEAWVELTISDERGNTLGRRGWVDEERYVDKKAHFYKVIFVDEQGRARLKRDPHNFRVPAFTRVVGPGLADLSRYRFVVPESAAGKKLTIRARLMWRKFNRDYMKFVFGEAGMKVPDLPHLQGQSIPDLPVTAIAEHDVTLEVTREWRASAPVNDGELWQRYNDHGIANLLTGAFDVAERSFAEVARLRPDLPDGYRNQARRWIKGATPKRAVPFLEKIDEIAPTDPQRAWFWGRYLERIEEFEEAEKMYLRTTRIFPADRNAWKALGRVRFKMHRYEEALPAYLEVLKIDSEDVESHRQRAHIYRLLGKEREAAEAQKAHDKYRKDDLAEQWTKKFLLEHPEINDSAQPRHIYALD